MNFDEKENLMFMATTGCPKVTRRFNILIIFDLSLNFCILFKIEKIEVTEKITIELISDICAGKCLYLI